MDRTSWKGLLLLSVFSIVLFVVIYLFFYTDAQHRAQQVEQNNSLLDQLQEVITSNISNQLEELYDIVELPELRNFLQDKAETMITSYQLPKFIKASETLEVFIIKDSIANAYTLPDGKILFTTELILDCENVAEVLSVLHHEVGHILYEHFPRSLLTRLSAVTLTAWITGGNNIAVMLSNIASLQFSRDFEREADEFAILSMQQQDISPAYFADFLQRVLTNKKDHNENKLEAIPAFLSSHPLGEERITNAKNAAVKFALSKQKKSKKQYQITEDFDFNFGIDWQNLQTSLADQLEQPPQE